MACIAKSRQPHQRQALVVLLALAASVPLTIERAHAFTDCEAALSRLRMLEVEEARTVEPETVAPREIMTPPQPLGTQDARSGRRARPAIQAASVTRRLPALWRIRVPRSVVPQQLVVVHRLAGDRTGRIAAEDGTAALDVRIRALPPISVCRNASDQIIEGSADLMIQFSRLPMAGRYLGTIETDVRVP